MVFCPALGDALLGPALQDLVLLPNATTGLNAVISSMSRLLTASDAVFSLDIGYPLGSEGLLEIAVGAAGQPP